MDESKREYLEVMDRIIKDDLEIMEKEYYEVEKRIPKYQCLMIGKRREPITPEIVSSMNDDHAFLEAYLDKLNDTSYMSAMSIDKITELQNSVSSQLDTLTFWLYIW